MEKIEKLFFVNLIERYVKTKIDIISRPKSNFDYVNEQMNTYHEQSITQYHEQLVTKYQCDVPKLNLYLDRFMPDLLYLPEEKYPQFIELLVNVI